MKLLLLIGMVIIALAVPARAQDNAGQAQLCRTMAGQGNANATLTGAAYQPGVDAHGRPVAPAETGTSIDMTPQTYQIPLTIDLASRLHIPAGAGTSESAGITGADPGLYVGMVEVTKDGRVSYNGQDITSQSQTVCNDPAAASQDKPRAGIDAPAAPHVPAKPTVVAPVMTPARSQASSPQGSSSAELNSILNQGK